MAITVRGSTATHHSNNSSVACTLPSGTAYGDFVILIIATAAAQDWTTLAGWSVVGGPTFGASGVEVVVIIRTTKLSQAEVTTGSLTLTPPNAGFHEQEACLLTFRSDDSTTGSLYVGATGASTTPTATSITTTNDQQVSVVVFGVRGITAFTGPPSGYTQHLSDSGGTEPSVWIGSATQAAGATGAKSITNANTQWTASHFALTSALDLRNQSFYARQGYQ